MIYCKNPMIMLFWLLGVFHQTPIQGPMLAALIIRRPRRSPSDFERFTGGAAAAMIARREFTARFPTLRLRLDLEDIAAKEPDTGIPCAVFLVTMEVDGRIVRERWFMSADTVELARVSPAAAIAALYHQPAEHFRRRHTTRSSP